MSSGTLENKAATRNGVSRMVIVLLSIFLEVIFILVMVKRLNEYYAWISILTQILAFFLILGIYGQHKTSSMKMPWIILILTFPVVGVSLYLLTGLNGYTKVMRDRYRKLDETLFPLLSSNDEVLSSFEECDPKAAAVSKYIKKDAHYPVYGRSRVTYYSEANDGLSAQLEELAKAEKFIFMEYHAIEDADSWQKIQDVLVERVKAGVEVRVFYDDMGSIGFVNTDFAKKLRSHGIACRVFNPFVPGLNIFLNNRDHRKITVVDGRVGFTGGYNIANEYFGLCEPYGKWKDTGIRIEGDAVASLTVTFLEMWNAVKRQGEADSDFSKYLTLFPVEGEGFIQPYADNPMDEEQVGENVYISIVEKAEKYCYFMTPYLIITDEMNHAISLAAKRGVDVRIVTPGIPDKKLVYSVTRSFYNGLVRNGVRIYEWRPGFCHAKMCVADGTMATCGTINLDYRSLYHHFENGAFFSHCEAVSDIRKDFDAIFVQCEEVTEKYLSERSFGRRFIQMIMRLFAELL